MGPGALQHAASPSRATQGELQVDLSGWPTVLRKPPSLWKMRALFQDLPGGGWNILWTGRLPQECCLRRWRGVCCAPGSGTQEVPATARARRRPGPVSLRRIGVMDLSAAASAGHQRLAAQWVLLAACQDPESRKQSANSPAFLQKCAQPGNLLVLVTFFLQRQTGDGCQVIALARRRRKTRMWLEGAIPDGSQHGLGLLAVTGPGSLLPPIHAGSRLV